MAVNVSVYHLFHSLCGCVLKDLEEDTKQRWLCSPLKLPDHLVPATSRPPFTRDQLLTECYDILLLRRKEWKNKLISPLSPPSCCVSHIYSLACEKDRARLIKCIDDVIAFYKNDSDSILTFLSILATAPSTREMTPISAGINRSFTYYPRVLFAQTPPLSSPDHQVFKATPSFSLYSQSSDPTLFSSLIHTTTSSIDVVLGVPPLGDTPPDILQLHIDGCKSFDKTPPIAPPLPVSLSQHDSVLDLITSFDGPHPPMSWDGPLSNLSSYLSESGPDVFDKSVSQFISHLSSMTNIPATPILNRDVSSVKCIMSQLSNCFVLMDQRKSDINLLGDDISRSFHQGIYSILNYCQALMDSLTHQDSSQFFLHSKASKISLMTNLVWKVLSGTSSLYTNGLSLLDSLYDHCINYQGLPLYPLLLGLFRQTIQSYLKFLYQWILNGIPMSCEGYGLIVNEDSLRMRDHNYWFDGVAFSGVPKCLLAYQTDILRAGKSLGLLQLCNPNSYILNYWYSPSPLVLGASIDDIKRIELTWERYQRSMEALHLEMKQEREVELLEKELKHLEPLMKKREELRKAMRDVKEEEMKFEREEIEKKRTLLNELKIEAERARVLRLEREAEETERDRQYNVMDQGRKDMEDEIKYQLESYYGELNRKAEARMVHAEWRARRFALGASRLQYMQEMKEKEEKELLEASLNGHATHVDAEIQTISNQTETQTTSNQTETQTISNQTETQTTSNQIETQTISNQTEIQTTSNQTETETSINQDVILVQTTTSCEYETDHIIDNRQQTTSNDTILSTRGKPPPSTIKDILYHHIDDDGRKLSPPVTKVRKPDAITKILYYGDKDENNVQRHQREYTVQYPDMKPFSYFTTSFPVNELPYTTSQTILPHMDPINTEDFIYIYSLPVLVDYCLAGPILTQATLVNKALLEYFTHELMFKDHLVLLKHYMLLEDGEFSNVICSGLFDQLMYGESLDVMCSSSFLSPLLTAALEQSSHLTLFHLEKKLSLKAKYKPSFLSTNSLKAMDFIYLNYKVDWPMNIIITDDHIYKYNQVLHFILQIKRASWILKKSFIILKQKLTSCTDVHMRFIYTQRQQLQHFVTVLECYIANQIFHLSWCELEHTLDQASNLDDLIKCHNDYLNTLLFRCLLNQKLQPILNIIDNCLGAVIKFGGHLLYQRAQPQTLHVIYNSFRDSSALLYKVIYKLVQKSYQPHLEEFLLCLDFNNFYSNYSSSRYR